MRVNRQGHVTSGRRRYATPPSAALAAQFVRQSLENHNNRLLLERLPSLGLPDAWLVAGCLFQTIWNLKDGRPPTADIKDYDLFYFDAADLSEQAEAAVGERVDACFRDLGVAVEAKNQARVHTWYQDWFGPPYSALSCSRDGIDRFLVPCTCVGLQAVRGATAALHAPYGLEDMYQGVLRPNPLCDHRDLFRSKAESYRARWNWLQIVEE